MLFREAQERGRILYPDEAMAELKKSVRVRYNLDDQTKKSSAQEYSIKERTTGTKFWRDIYHVAVDYHFDFYRGLANKGGRPRKDAESLETARLKEQGMSNNALAKKLGITRDAVLKRRRRAGELLLSQPPAPSRAER